MDETAAALGDTARWRIVELLAERPRSVGELAELIGARQPQTTKHLQALARAGIVSVFPLGQRRVYALEQAPLARLADRLRELAESAGGQRGDRDVIERYRAAIEADSAAATGHRWADGRDFSFDRILPANRDVVWRHWIDPELLATWWTPPSMTISELAFEAKAGGRVILEYRDADGLYRSAGTVQTAKAPEHLVFDLAVLDPDGSISFTGRYDLSLSEVADGTRLRLDLRITDTSVEAAPFIAGIEPGWGQVLDNLTAVIGAYQLPREPSRAKKVRPRGKAARS